MNKFLGTCLVFLISVSAAFSADMRFIQVDDLLYSPDNTKFEKMINNINKQKDVEFIVFTGNNISKPDIEYLQSFLKTAKKLKKPYYIIIGNKDVNKQKDLSKAEYMKIVSRSAHTHKRIKTPNYVFEKNGVVFIVVDGSKDVIPSSMGYYKTDVMDWLNKQLNFYHNKNVVILQHFPIVPPAQKESHYTFKADEYLQFLVKHKNVKAVISGHFNTNNEQTVNGIVHISTADAPVYRIIDILDYDTKKPVFWSVIKN